jgi:hypothetical protein
MHCFQAFLVCLDLLQLHVFGNLFVGKSDVHLAIKKNATVQKMPLAGRR